jgi:hypothetical protein
MAVAGYRYTELSLAEQAALPGAGTSGRRHPCIQPSGPVLKPVQNEGTSAFKSGFGFGGGVVFLGELL